MLEEALLPLALMRIGGLDPMRTASLVTSMPLAALYVVMAASLVRSLAEEAPPQSARSTGSARGTC